MATRKRRTEQERAREAAGALLRLSAADLSAHAARPEYQQFPPWFHMTCRRYAKREHWTLHESACLLCGFDPKRPRDVLPGHEAGDHYLLEIEERIERSSLWVGGKVEHEYLRATDVMEWALSNLVLVPRVLLWAMGHDIILKGDDWTEAAAIERPKQRNPQGMRRRAKEIAKKLWTNNPKMTIEEVIAHADLEPVSDPYPRLLCLALRADSLSKRDLTKFRDRGWRIVHATAGGSQWMDTVETWALRDPARRAFYNWCSVNAAESTSAC